SRFAGMHRCRDASLRVAHVLIAALAGCGTSSGTTAPDAGNSTKVAPALTGAPSAEPSGATSASTTSAGRDASPPRTFNVLMITMDAVRADMPWQGYPRDIAPNLTQLAKESVVYTHAYSVSSYTAKSFGAILSGRYPRTLYRDGSFFTKY